MATIVPDTVQTERVVDAKATSRPEDAVALIVNGATPSVRLLNMPNVIVCDAGPGAFTVKSSVT
jgi:hypothetical protein